MLLELLRHHMAMFWPFGEGVLCVSGEASNVAIIFLSPFLSFLI